ncbi:MAG: LamG-like jellyroll fold domain-containing protein [Candidatus Paceibacterota bacterium]|jgi:prepilin-type N-terminal cleavage/methylation domain-containing protein
MKIANKAFTLIELLVVIAIVGILAGMVVINMSGATDTAKIAKSKAFSSSVRSSLLMNRVSEWKLEEGTGATTADTVASGSGTLVNGPVWKAGADCVSGGCLQFSGASTQYVVSSGQITVPENGTIEGWIKGSAALQKNENIYPFGLDYVSLLGPGATSDSRAGIITGTGGSYDHLSWGGQNLYNGSWHHYVVTWTKGTSNYSFRLYIDGKKIGDPLTGTRHPAGALRNVKIGAAWGTYGAHTGLIDDVRIYDAALALSFIRDQYLAGIENLLFKGQITNKEYQQRSADLNLNYAIDK